MRKGEERVVNSNGAYRKGFQSIQEVIGSRESNGGVGMLQGREEWGPIMKLVALSFCPFYFYTNEGFIN
jgi:hypothetical protein